MKSILGLLFFLSFTSCFSQRLISYKLLPCNEIVAQHIYRDRIISQKKSGDSLIFELALTANCSAEFTPVLRHRNDTLFLELSNISEVYTACDCCYNMLFYLSDTSDFSSYKLFVNNRELKYSKSRYIDFPPRETPTKLLKNETDSKGNKIGYWKIEGKKGHYIIYFGDGSTINNYSIWEKKFNDKNELESVSILFTTPDISESYHAIFEKERYLKIITEIEAENE